MLLTRGYVWSPDAMRRVQSYRIFHLLTYARSTLHIPGPILIPISPIRTSHPITHPIRIPSTICRNPPTAPRPLSTCRPHRLPTTANIIASSNAPPHLLTIQSDTPVPPCTSPILASCPPHSGLIILRNVRQLATHLGDNIAGVLQGRHLHGTASAAFWPRLRRRMSDTA